MIFNQTLMILYNSWTKLRSFLLIVLLFGCSENFSDNPLANQPPRTFLSIFTDNDLSPATSKRTLNWWGDDPDGFVVGFIYTFNPNAQSVTTWSNDNPDPNWTFTTETQETFVLTLAGTDTIYTFWVKAVDDEGAADPDGALQEFNIINSRPEVAFPVGTDVPETTFTVAAFVWRGTDLDGDDTIARYQYVLDDTSNSSAWIDISPQNTSLALTAENGLTGGEHVFFLRAIDLAGATSSIIRMPRSENEVWFVREPRSNFLIIDDYNIADDADNFYKTSIEAIVGPVDVWDIKSNGGALEPPSNLAFTLTLQLFDRILWYGDTGPNLDKAQVSIPDFIENGGKILMTTSFMEFATNQGDPLIFSPIDSLGVKINRITRNQLLLVEATFANMGFQDLQINAAIIPNVFPLVPKISSTAMYALPENPGSWPGTPVMAAINASSTFVFFGLPIAKLDGLGTANQLIEKIITEIF